MKIHKIESGYTELINIGYRSLFIYLDNNGYEYNIDDIIEQSIHFNRVIITSNVDEIFLQKEDISKFTKKLLKKNTNVIIEYHTLGTIKPISSVNYDRVIYNVSLQLKNTKIKYENRIKENVISWYILTNANFIFVVHNEDEIDEVISIINDVSIPKHKVFIVPLNNYSIILEKSKLNGFNFSPYISLN